MEKTVNIYLFGKQYSVPEDLTIMRAMEYAGYQLVRGCGCRNGFCGASAPIYRIKGETALKTTHPDYPLRVTATPPLRARPPSRRVSI